MAGMMLPAVLLNTAVRMIETAIAKTTYSGNDPDVDLAAPMRYRGRCHIAQTIPMTTLAVSAE
jgi:hypothetical protein